MSLSISDVNPQLDRFKKLAPGFEIKFGDIKEDRYVHILRDGKIIGCFARKDGIIIFKFHNSYPGILANDLTDEEIKDVILKTSGNETQP